MEFFASYTGPDFLLFYCIMLATSVLAGLWIPAVLRDAGRRAQLDVPEEIAVLAGGSKRHMQTVLSSLMSKEAMERAGRHKLRTSCVSQSPQSGAEAAVMSIGSDFTLGRARKALATQAAQAKHRLTALGLFMPGRDHTKLSLLATLPYVALFCIGLYRQQAGSALGEPTGLLVVLLCVTLLFGLIRLFTVSPRTKAGQELVRSLEASESRLKRAPRQGEVGFAVAIFGTGVLVGTPWEPLHAVERAGSAGGDTGGGDSDGGGGGCGGGCGGCGG